MIKILFLFFFAFNLVNPQSTLKMLSRNGENHLLHFNFDKSEETFNEIIEKYPNDPTGYYLQSKMHMWFYLGSKDEGEYLTFIKYSDLALGFAENVYKDDDSNPHHTYLLGNIYLTRAFTSTTSGNSLDAFWATKKGISYFEETLELDSNFYDAYLGLGLFKYALSYVPSIFKWALELTGMSGDKRNGLNYIKQAYQGGRYTVQEAAFHLAKIYTEYNAEYDSAEVLLKRMIQNYPENLLFHYQYAILKIEQRDLKSAAVSLKKVIKNPHDKFKQTTAFANFLLGEIAFRKNNFEEAKNFYNNFLETTLGFDYSGIAYYHLALCNAFRNDSIDVRNNLLLARNGNLDIEDDLYALKMSELLYDVGISSSFLKMVKAKNSLLNTKYNECYDLLRLTIDSLNTPDLKGEALLILGEAAINKKDYDLALTCAFEAKEMKYQFNEWIVPFAHYLSALAYYKKKETEKGKLDLLKSEELNTYNFRHKIEPKINKLKKLYFL